MRKIELDIEQIISTCAQSQILPLGMSAHSYEEMTREVLVTNLVAYFAAKTVKELTVEVSTLWWDALKLRFFPRWLLARFPAKRERLHCKVVHICPHSTTTLPLDRAHIYFLLNEDTDRFRSSK